MTGKVTRRGGSPLLVASARVVRRGKTLRRKTTSISGGKVKKGKFSLSIKVGKIPSGARLQVDVVLLDQAAGLATARRTVKAR